LNPLFDFDQTPENWVDLGNIDFSYFLVTKQPYISDNFYSSPLAKIDDGINSNFISLKASWNFNIFVLKMDGDSLYL
jgi:hypothetical protein